MSKKLLIRGNKLLEGDVYISGSKNCALGLISASLLIKDKVVLYNIPRIDDVFNLLRIIEKLNVKTTFKNNTLIIDSSKISYIDLDFEEMSKLRASYYLLGIILPHVESLYFHKNGGCNFVNRGIDYHLEMFKHFGYDYKEQENGYYFIKNNKKSNTYLNKSLSFGLTINEILFALSHNEDFVFKNIVYDQEIKTIIKFLIKSGAHIEYQDHNLYIYKSKLKSINFSNIYDSIESGMFLMIGATSAKELRIHNFKKKYHPYILKIFEELDLKYLLKSDILTISKQELNKSLVVETGLNEGLSSDLQPIFCVFCLKNKRICLIKENVYKQRYSHIEPLQKMLGLIYQERNIILTNGIFDLVGNEFVITDLRMGASLIYAGLCASEETTLLNTEILNRGYENLFEKILNIGGDIRFED